MSSIFLNTSSSSSSTTSSSSTLRVPGLASGLDTDSIVKSMVSNYQNKIDKANQAKELLQWKQEAYRDIIKGVKDLQNYFDPLSSKYILGDSSMNINSVDSSDTSIASATALSTAKAGTYSVNVTKLAKQAEIKGDSKNSTIIVKDLSNWSGKVINFSSASGDKTTTTSIKLDDIGDRTQNSTNMSKLVENINNKIANSDLKGQISASYVKIGDDEYVKFTNSSSNTVKISSDVTGDMTINNGISSSTKLTDLNMTDTTTSFKVNDKKVSLKVDSSTTLQNLMDAVKSATNGDVTMSIDNTTGAISFTSKNYGSSSSVKLEDDSNKTLSNLGITGGSYYGEDALVSIKEPGQSQPVISTQSSNSFTVDGISYNLVNTGNTSITVTADSSKVVDNMKSFITDYNTIITTINTKLTEKKDNDYQPLTDSQKESMSDSQITAWESKAKVGILRNDDYLSQLMTQLRGVFSSSVYSNYNSSDTTSGKLSLNFGQYGSNVIGIDTSSDYSDGGKLVIKDETKLKNAIENNFDEFKKLFTGSSDSTLSSTQSYVGSKKYEEDGLLKRIDTILRDYVAAPGLGKDGTYTLSGSMNIFVNKQYDYSSYGSSSQNTLLDKLYSKTLSISKLKTQMSDAETRYYNKFSALETALTQLNSQQSSLSYMLGTN